MIVGRIVEEFADGMVRVRADPACRVITRLDPREECGRPATVRRNHWPFWSEFWCPEHAAAFASPGLWFRTDDIDEPTFMRLRATS